MNPNCPDKLKKIVPLSKVVSASIIDLWEDIGKMQQLHYHWAARGFKKLQREVLKSGKRSALLEVSENTRTASLPPDFDTELFIGYIEKGHKFAIPLHTNLINKNSIEEIPCEDACPVCNQDKKICTDLTVTQSTELVVVNGSTYEKTTIKKLYPDGNYFLETTIPYWDIANNMIAYATTKEYIAQLDLKDCGCLENTEKNIETVKEHCFDAYCSHYAPCEHDREGSGYKIFEESGLIQLDFKFRHKYLYIEYIGFLPKINGQYAVPEVAFETLVEFTKFHSLEGRRNISNPDKKWRWDMFINARNNMEKEMGRISLDNIIYMVGLTPKFNWDAPAWNNYHELSEERKVETITNAVITGCDALPLCAAPSPVRTPFRLAVIVPVGIVPGLPIAGQSSYQNDFLIGALNVDYIIVNDTNESRNLGKFTFDSTTGTLDRSPNIWFAGDSLIIDFFKMV